MVDLMPSEAEGPDIISASYLENRSSAGLDKTMNNKPTKYDFIYGVIKRIPKGRVSTYGRISSLAGINRQPRMVGYALAALPEDLNVPWHRVINYKGEISKRSDSYSGKLQRIMLESEGVVFDSNGRVSLKRYLWRPKIKVDEAGRLGDLTLR